MSSDHIKTATRIDTRTGEKKVVSATQLFRPERIGPALPSHVAVQPYHEFYCTDCLVKNRRVKLNFVSAARRKTTSQTFSRVTGEVIGDVRELYHVVGNHFIRHRDALSHRCDHPARYASLRQFCVRVNGKENGENKFLLPLGLPGERWHHEQEAAANDMRTTRRFSGLDMGGITHAVQIADLIDLIHDDPELVRHTAFHDGIRIRSFQDVYCEDISALYACLIHDAGGPVIGRNQSVIVAAVLRPNIHYEVVTNRTPPFFLNDYRTVQVVGPDGRMQVVRAQINMGNWETDKAARRMAASPQGDLLALGEAWLAPHDHFLICMDIFNPAQVAASRCKIGLRPQIDPLGQRALAL